jgi:predicted GNAT superfamily acetyltransferase
VALQEDTWGKGFSERVPVAILKVTTRIGGVVAGAFDASGGMLGFVFGMTGAERGADGAVRLVHWSDMLAVRPAARDLGIGRRLKAYQREAARALGVGTIYWTYDPLVARNAHLNIVRLGARPVEYAVNMYGAETDSPLHRGIGSDRFVVAWDVSAEPAEPREPITTDPATLRAPVLTDDPRALAARPPVLRVEIPCDIGAVQASSLERAAAWRASTRQAFVAALEARYEVVGFHRDRGEGRCHYILRQQRERG